MKLLLKLLLFLFLIVGGLGIFGYSRFDEVYSQWRTSTLPLETPVEVVLKPGTSLELFSEQLLKKGLVDNSLVFRLFVRFDGNYSRFQAGRYRFVDEVSPEIIVAKITSGEVYNPTVLQIAIPEGFTQEQVLSRLHAKGVGELEELRALSKDRAFLDELRVQGKSLEGYLYPATYSFTSNPDARTALTTMVNQFWKTLPEGYEGDLQKHDLTLQEALAFASLIEKETATEDERTKVSEVIWNRLRKNVPLGIDASIIYGIADYKGDITRAHLKDASNPYNSRLHKGLPPTPICSPSSASMAAVLNPTSEGWFYYVLDPETGGHHFSKSLKEHNKYVRKLVNYSRKRR